MPGLWKLPRCGNGGKIDQRKQSFCLSFFHSFPHRLENSALQENPPEATQPSFPQFPQPLFLLLTYPRPDLLILPRQPLTYPLFRIWWDATPPPFPLLSLSRTSPLSEPLPLLLLPPGHLPPFHFLPS